MTSETPAEPPFTPLRVARKWAAARDIVAFELRHPQGEPLPGYTAGAHLTVEVPGGARRNYSLWGDPQDTSAYRIAVKRDAKGRGGSIAMADAVHEGDLLPVSVPRNNFELDARAPRSLLIAGGIGITPVLSMMTHLQAQGRGDFRLIYCTRDAPGTAFQQELAAFGDKVLIHHDNGDPGAAYDFWPLLENPGSEHIYCCGPQPLMDAVADMSGHWPSGSVHFESFGVDASAWAANTPFTVRLARSGAVVPVAPDQSILEALRGHGLRVPSSCESGTCGTCRTGLLEGTAEHRDMVLNEEERASAIMVCVSRALTPELVLDL